MMSGVITRLLSAFLCCSLAGLAGATESRAATPAAIAPVSQTSQLQTTRPGQPFATPLQAIVTDANGQPVAGASVHFQVPATGATAVLSAADAVTDAGGVASVTATANATAGYYVVKATVTGVTAPANYGLLNLATGFSPGEQLADVAAPDHTGASHTLREFLGNGHNYLIIDACTMWCPFCQQVAGDAPGAIADLAAQGVTLHVVPLLQQGPTGAPSTQANAQQWHDRFSLTEPVLHASGSNQTAAYTAGTMILRSTPDAGVPTSILVRPDGTILDRKVGGQFLTHDGILERVLADVNSDVKPARSVALTVARGAATASGTAAPELQTPFGAARVEPSLRLATLTETLNFRLAATTAFHSSPDLLHVEITPAWDDGRPRTLNSTTAEVRAYTTLNGQPFQFEPGPIVPVSFANGKITADVDLADIRQQLADGAAGAGLDDTQTQELLDGLRTLDFDVFLHVNPTPPAGPTLSGPAGPSRATSVTVSGAAPAGTTVALYLTSGCTGTPALTTTVAGLAQGVAVPVPLNATSHVHGQVTAPSGQVSACTGDVAFIQDSTPPLIKTLSDVRIETTASSVVYKYAPPPASDKVDGAIIPACTPKSGSSFPQGKTEVRCIATDRAGNSAGSAFTVVVARPLTSGAVFKRGGTRKLTTAARGLKVVVSAGGYQPISPVRISFFGADGARRALGTARAGLRGRFAFKTRIPPSAPKGAGQVVAVGRDRKGHELTRVWVLRIT